MEQFSIQTFTKAKTVPFNYDLYDIMPIQPVGKIIKDHMGKQWEIVSSRKINCVYDLDDWQENSFGSGCSTVNGKAQVVKVREYYKPYSPEWQLYRKTYSGYHVRVA